MAWESITWACGHSGQMQLYGPGKTRRSTLAFQAGRICLACWLAERWQATRDSRFGRADREDLVLDIVAGKGIRISDWAWPEGAPAPEEV